MTAEQQKTECHAEHFRLAEICSVAEQKVSVYTVIMLYVAYICK